MLLFTLDRKEERIRRALTDSCTKTSRKRRSISLPHSEECSSEQLFIMNQLQQKLLEAAISKQKDVSANFLLGQVFPQYASEGSNSSQENIDPTEQQVQDTGLTNLTWLSDLRAKDLTPFAKPPSSEEPSSDEEGEDYNIIDITLSKEQRAKLNPSLRRNLVELTMYYKNSSPNYLVNPIKPPYSYATMILLALVSHPQKCVPLCDIYSWIRANFRYFVGADQSWQNSIRHNLSLNPLFVKATKHPDDGRKGHCWEISQDFQGIVHDHMERLSQLGDIKISQSKQKPLRVKKRNGTTSASKRKAIPKKGMSRCGNPLCSVADPLRVEDLDWMNLLGHSRPPGSCLACSSQPTHAVGYSPLVSPIFLHSETDPHTSTYMSPIASVTVGINDSTPAREFDFLKPPRRDESPVQLFTEAAPHNPNDPKSILECPHPWAESKEDTLQYLKDFQQTIETFN